MSALVALLAVPSLIIPNAPVHQFGQLRPQRTLPASMAIDDAGVARPRVAIEYCTRCNWLMRSAWYATALPRPPSLLSVIHSRYSCLPSLLSVHDPR